MFMCQVSVVIPAYNREKTIEKAIASVLNQTVKPFEIIVVDDKSTDSTVKLVHSLCQDYSIIKLICLKKNSGAQAARNYGIKAAKGEWIAFLDSDDELRENTLEIHREVANSHPEYDVFYGDCLVKRYGRTRYWNLKVNGKNGDCSEGILFKSGVLFGSLFVKKTALMDIGLLDDYVPSYQEWDTSIRLSVNHRFYYINKPLFTYNLHDGETISKDLKRDISGFQYVVMSNRKRYLMRDDLKGILFYYDGMYARLNKCKDIKKNYYRFLKTILRFVSTNQYLSRKAAGLIGIAWDKRWERIYKGVACEKD